MYPKFIVNENRLIIGMAFQHRMLARNHNSTLGGGWWHIDEATQRIWLYASSQVFGPVKKEILKEIIAKGNHDYPGYSFYFSRESSLEAAMENSERL